MDDRLLHDVTKLTMEDFIDHMVVYGGFPCQNHSTVGLNEGFEADESVLKVLELLQQCPWVELLLLENVE